MSRKWLLIIGVVILIAAGAAFLLIRKGKPAEADAEVAPTASITVSPVRSETVSDMVTVYGVVQADPAGAITVAAPKAVIVSRVLVRSGQTVSAGQALVEVANAPASDLAYKQAADAVTFARNDLARVQRLYDEHLAATDQLTAARKTLADSEAALAAQQKSGSGKALLTLTAPQAGVVTNVAAAPGDHVAQDAPLVVLARSGGSVAKLGLEPGAGGFSAGQAVTIRPVSGGAPIATRLTMVGRAADQTTKTLDAIAPLNGVALPIGAAVQGEVSTGAHSGFLVPRAAVVFDETGPHLFVVSGGKARRVFVNVGRDHGDNIEISGQIPAGAQVAVEGAYELQDGMAVKVSAK
jgi:RND family efflux transporter MFP subunit